MNKKGFETIYNYPQGFVKWSFSEALNSNGESLGNSTKTETFVVSPDLGNHLF